MSAVSSHPVMQDDFLSRYADELDGLARGLETLQTTLAEARVRSEGGTEGMQALDALTQRAHALAQIARRMTGLGSFSDPTIRLMIANVKLADVAARLTGKPPPASPELSGEVEIF